MAGTLQAQHILSRVRNILQDNTAVRWTDGELFDYLSDAQREVANFRPDSTALHSNVQLTTGTEQTIPSNGLRLINVVRNMSGTATNATGGRVVRRTEFEAINSVDPDWHNPTATGSAAHGTEIKNFMFDPRDPRTFYVYPGVSGNAYVEVIYSKNPTSIGAATDLIQVDDIFANPLIDYVLYKAYLKDAEASGGIQKASAYFNAFQVSLGTGISLQESNAPQAEAMRNNG